MKQKLDKRNCEKSKNVRLTRFPEKKWYTKLATALYEKAIGSKERKTQELLKKNPEEFVQRMFPNPVIAAQAKGELVFEPDYYLGHTFPAGKDFLGKDGFLSVEATIEEVKKTGKRVILNIGDSSTSGWDSDVIAINRERRARGEEIELPFFRYKTYSDCLRELVGKEFVVINAGVPAHTSVHGARRLRLLLEMMARAGVHVDYVTIYYGNNDSSWNGSRRDNDLIPKEKQGVFERINEALFNRFVHFRLSISKKLQENAEKKTQRDVLITRTSVEDYGMYLRQMISLCVKHKAVPILMEPQIPLYWEPGKRVKGEGLSDVSHLAGGASVYSLLKRASEMWKHIIAQEYSEAKIGILKQIRELDFVVPRIKEDFIRMLRHVASSTSTPIITVELDRKEDDIRYFCDYCHPIESANQLIAMEIERVIREGKHTIKLTAEPKPEKLSTALQVIIVIEKILSIFIRTPTDKKDATVPSEYDSRPSDKIYTLW